MSGISVFHVSKQTVFANRRSLLRLAILLAALVLLGGMALFTHFSQRIVQKTQEDLSVIAHAKIGLIERFLLERYADAKMLGLRPEVLRTLLSITVAGDDNVSAHQPGLTQLAQQMANAYGYHDVRIFDAALHTLGAVDSDPLMPVEREVFQRVLRSGHRRLVDFHLSGDGRICFGVASPIFAAESTRTAPIGVVYLEVDSTARFEPMITRWPSSSATSETVLFQQNGDNMVFLIPSRFTPAGELFPSRSRYSPDLISASLTRARQSSLLRGKDYRGVEVMAAGAPIAGTPWYLMVKTDYREAARPVRQLGWAVGLATGSVLLLLSLAAFLYQRGRLAVEAAATAELDARYLAARRASIDGYLVFSDEGQILDANEAMSTLTGYAAAELRQHSLPEVGAQFSATDIAPEIEALHHADGHRFYTQWRRKDGVRVELEVNVTYLPEAQGGTFHAFIHDIGPQLAAQRRIERLNAFYVFLSNANVAIFNLNSVDAILDAVCEGAVRDGGFILAWAAVLDENAGQVIPTAATGVASDYVKKLVITTDPALPTSHGPTRMCMLEGRILHVDDFQQDSRTIPWRGLSEIYGIHSSAAVPLFVEGKAVGALNFYSSEIAYFDEEFRTLLQEVARNVSLAWQALAAAATREQAQQQHEESERRFARVFAASPIPQQIQSASSGQFRAINKAHERVFGYRPEELPDQASWFEKVYSDPVFRQQIADVWQRDIERVIAEGPDAMVSSQELTLRCKDGSSRVVRGFVSVNGDDVIVQWLDLTDIKQAEATLMEREQDFRGMIEQTLTGIYVTQDDKIVFVNPRMSDIIGWPTEDLLGRDSLSFFARSPDIRAQVLASRQHLAGGTASVALNLPFRCRDGREIILGTHASRGMWDRRPAIIVLAQDITERQHAEEKIAAYLQQLEGTMRGTLQAVANMVDLRDPYTAGHERRVGMIAADIAREMGWSEERCQNLQLIGLIHDIGKIAIPAEILSKPTRLTQLEYEMIKTHAEKGYEILKHVQFPLPIAEIIREHHERMDGSGYPRGLKGEEILPEARVLAVADVLESMASHRPYRPSLGIDAAAQEIEQHRGIWFDAAVVDAMLRLIREQGYPLPL